MAETTIEEHARKFPDKQTLSDGLEIRLPDVPVSWQKALPTRFSPTEKQKIANDLQERVLKLATFSWWITDTTTLSDAIQRSTAELDASAMAYMFKVSQQTFIWQMFSKDIVAAFTNLKTLKFQELELSDLKLIVKALQKNKHHWGNGPREVEVSAIKKFCGDLVKLIDSWSKDYGLDMSAVGMLRL